VTSIEPMTAQHWRPVHEIYAAGIAGGDATFETAPPSWAEFDATHLPEHRFVAIVDGTVAGWVAVAPVSARRVYAGVVEHSVYVDPAYAGRGIGRALLAAAIESTEAAGIWTLRAGVFPENVASLALHEQLGFRQIGVHERLGRDRGVWRDVVLLERRSRIAGS
jgi:L-amino acid N-acyltransferase YncA